MAKCCVYILEEVLFSCIIIVVISFSTFLHAFTAFQFWLTQSVNAVCIVPASQEATLTQRVVFYKYSIHAFLCPDWPLDINEVKT